MLPGVDLVYRPACQLLKIAEPGPLYSALVDNAALSPALRVALTVDPGWMIKAAAVVEIQHQINLGTGYDRLDSADVGVVGICF